MKWIKTLLASCFLFLFTLLCFGQDPPTLESLEERLEKIEKIEEIHEEKLNLAVKKHQMTVDSVTNHKKEEINTTLAQWKNSFIITFIVFLGISIASILGIAKYIESQYKTRIDTLIDNKQSHFLAMIKDKEIENSMRTYRKLLVLYINSKDEEEIRTIVNEFKFTTENVKYRHYTNEKTTKEKQELEERIKEADLVILHSPNGAFDDQLLAVVEAHSNKYFVNYHTGSTRAPTHEQVNFANSKYTLYHSVILTLKYKELQDSKPQA